MSKKNSSIIVLSLALLLLPLLSFAAPSWGGEGYFSGMATTFSTVITTLLPAFMGLAFLGFFWFLFRYITSSAEDKAKAKSGLLWSVIAIIIMISIYGIANFAQNLFGVTEGNSTIEAPNIN